jgi:hypothetical protein
MLYGVIYHTSAAGKALIAIGALITLSSLIGWGIEPLEEPMEHHEDDGDHLVDVEEGQEADLEEVLDE